MSRILPATIPFDSVKDIVKKLELKTVMYGNGSVWLSEKTAPADILPGEYHVSAPEIYLQAVKTNDNCCKYHIEFTLSMVPYSPYFNDTQLSDFAKSEFLDRMSFYQRNDRESVLSCKLKGSVEEIAKFITYHLRLLNYDNSIRFIDTFDYTICKGDLSKAKFPEGFKAAQSIIDALTDLIETYNKARGDWCWLYFFCGSLENILSEDLSGVMRFVINRDTSGQFTELFTLWEDVEAIRFIVEDEEEILRYHNHEIFDIDVDGPVSLGIEFPLDDINFCAKILTDYLINVKGLKAEDIMAVSFLTEDDEFDNIEKRVYPPENHLDNEELSDNVYTHLRKLFKEAEDNSKD